MEFGVLGPVEVQVAGRHADAGHLRQRGVLAVLLLDMSKVVPVELLIDRVWGSRPPSSVRNVVYGYVSRLRAVIAAAADPDVTLIRHPGGYVLRARAEQLDLHRFRQLVTQAAAAANDLTAATMLQDALSLWRGQALAGLDSPWLHGMRETLEQQRASAALDLNDIRLRQGQHAALIGELIRQAVESPADERLIGQLMLALYRSGRQAQALRWYEQTRRHLVEQFGTDPSQQLQTLQQQILRTDRLLALPEPAITAPGSVMAQSGPVAQELPADVRAFTGREAELAELDRLLADPADRKKAAAVSISVISGTAGIGKTALAVHWAHRTARHFPDGHLYVNLQGYDPGQPVPAADALARFLRSLGVQGQDIPSGEDERATRFRTMLAGKRMLVVLDNASSADQVRPLLPGTAGCAVLVTSRDTLAGLAAGHGAARLELDVLPPQAALELLRVLIGAKADDEPDAAAELVNQCSRLPLALRVAAELAASRPAASLATLTDELADMGTRLDVLTTGGDARTEVRAVFSWSYLHLDPEHAQTFRLLGLHPAQDIDLWAAAALTGATTQRARTALDALARAHLIQATAAGRYGMHDLLRSYACDLATAVDGAEENQAALTRLLDYYLYTAAAAMDTLFPAERHRRPRIPRPATPVPSLEDAEAAREWLDDERTSLVAATRHATGQGWPDHATGLAATLAGYLRNNAHYPEALIVFGYALDAARNTGDLAAAAAAHIQIGLVDGHQSRFQQAVDHHQQALDLFRAVGDRTGEARALGSMSLAEMDLGRHGQAVRHQEEALIIYRDIGDRLGEADAIGFLGLIRRMQGRYQEAGEYYRRSLDLCHEIGNTEGEGYALGRLGVVDLWLGRYLSAAGYLQQALALFNKLGYRANEAEILVRIGDAYQGLDRHQQAAGHYEKALAMSRDISDPGLEADALNGLGSTFLQTGNIGSAREHHTIALRLASQANMPREQARAHSGLARACETFGDTDQARRHWTEALTRYSAIGDPRAREIRARLDAHNDTMQQPPGS